MTIRILSLDFDGCLFNLDYNNSDDRNIILHNQAFLDRLKEENQSYSKVYTFVGSNRQSHAVDFVNTWRSRTGSCFTAVKTVSDYLESILDTFLLADIFGDLIAGTSYERAVDKSYQEEHSNWLFDETKVTIIYAQAHKMALMNAISNPDEDIVLDFYDDRGNGAREYRDILEKLRDFYSEQSHLLPANLSLRLHQYAGKEVTTIATIKGTGFIDENYRQTVKDLSKQVTNSSNDGINKPIHVADFAKPAELGNRKAFLADNSVQTTNSFIDKVVNSFEDSSSTYSSTSEDDLSLSDYELNNANAALNALNSLSSVSSSSNSSSASSDESEIDLPLPKFVDLETEVKIEDETVTFAKLRFADALADIFDKAAELDLAGDALYDKELSEQDETYFSYKTAAQDARTLYGALKLASERYYEDGDKKGFNEAADNAIDIARNSELKNHRGYLKEILYYSGLAVLALLSVATAGLAYAVAGGLNYAINRQFFFSTTVNTDSINRVETAEEAVSALTAPAA